MLGDQSAYKATGTGWSPLVGYLPWGSQKSVHTFRLRLLQEFEFKTRSTLAGDQ